jgi:hypothetical protein
MQLRLAAAPDRQFRIRLPTETPLTGGFCATTGIVDVDAGDDAARGFGERACLWVR